MAARETGRTGQVAAPPMVEVPAGHTTLRDGRTEAVWRVEVSAFTLAVVPVTQGLYQAVTGAAGHSRRAGYGGGAHGDGGSGAGPSGQPEASGPGAGTEAGRDRVEDGLPVTEVSWFDALRFCDLLSQVHGLTPCYGTSGGWNSTGPDPRSTGGPDGSGLRAVPGADGYRLPTEAEWEHACRAGSTGARYGELDAIAWHRGNSDGGPQRVGGRRPNPWGLHDMVGNVWEWCWDLYDPRVYGPYRVFRGGGWNDRHWVCRASSRRKSHPTLRIDDLGFRVARSL